MDSLSLGLILKALASRLMEQRVRAVWRSRRTDLYLAFEEEKGIHLSFADPVALCVHGFPRKLPRTSDVEALAAADALIGRTLENVEYVPGERIFVLRFGTGEISGSRGLLVSLVPGRAGFLLETGGSRTGRNTLQPLFTPHASDDVTPILAEMSRADIEHTQTLLLEKGSRLPPHFRAEVIAAIREPGVFRVLQETLEAYLAGQTVPVVHRLPTSDLPGFLGRTYLAPFPYLSLGECRRFPDIEVAASFYLGLSRSIAEDTALFRSVRQYVTATARRLDSAEDSLASDREKAGKADLYQQYGQALLGLPPEVRTSPVAARWYDEGGEHEIAVPLPDGLDARGSAQKYFDLAKKCRRSASYIALRRKTIKARRAALLGIRSALDSIQSRDDLHRLAHLIPGVRAVSASPNRPAERRPYLEFECDDGSILIGRSAAENMVVTFKEAASQDIWLHAHDVPGSHVVVKLRRGLREPSHDTLVRAASLAAFFSKAKNETRVDVCYTQRKYVRKMKGGVLGQVRLERFKTMLVAPAGDTD